jgi:hypothetical protein
MLLVSSTNNNFRNLSFIKLAKVIVSTNYHPNTGKVTGGRVGVDGIAPPVLFSG